MILAIDYGEKRIGLALADEKLKIPLPFKILENRGREFILQELFKIIEQEEVRQVIVGLPLNLKGEKSIKAKEVEEFINGLEQVTKVIIETIDERFSSRLADVLGGENGKNRDIGAAMVILEDYLSRQSLARDS